MNTRSEPRSRLSEAKEAIEEFISLVLQTRGGNLSYRFFKYLSFCIIVVSTVLALTAQNFEGTGKGIEFMEHNENLEDFSHVDTDPYVLTFASIFGFMTFMTAILIRYRSVKEIFYPNPNRIAPAREPLLLAEDGTPLPSSKLINFVTGTAKWLSYGNWITTPISRILYMKGFIGGVIVKLALLLLNKINSDISTDLTDETTQKVINALTVIALIGFTIQYGLYNVKNAAKNADVHNRRLHDPNYIYNRKALVVAGAVSLIVIPGGTFFQLFATKEGIPVLPKYLSGLFPNDDSIDWYAGFVCAVNAATTTLTSLSKIYDIVAHSKDRFSCSNMTALKLLTLVCLLGDGIGSGISALLTPSYNFHKRWGVALYNRGVLAYASINTLSCILLTVSLSLIGFDRIFASSTSGADLASPVSNRGGPFRQLTDGSESRPRSPGQHGIFGGRASINSTPLPADAVVTSSLLAQPEVSSLPTPLRYSYGSSSDSSV